MRKLKISSLNRQDNRISYISIAIFPVLPFISVLLLAVSLLSEHKRSDRIYYAFFFLLASYLGLINITKIPDNDLVQYLNHYESIDGLSFIEYVCSFNKEPVFFAYNYLAYHLLNGNTQLYIGLTSVIGYLFIFMAIYKFFKAVSNDNYVIVFAITLAAFFPNFLAYQRN